MAEGLEVQQYIKGYKRISLMITSFKESTENFTHIETEYKVHRDVCRKNTESHEIKEGTSLIGEAVHPELLLFMDHEPRQGSQTSSCLTFQGCFRVSDIIMGVLQTKGLSLLSHSHSNESGDGVPR